MLVDSSLVEIKIIDRSLYPNKGTVLVLICLGTISSRVSVV